MKINTFVISGNRDFDEPMNFGSNLFEANELYISTKYERTLYEQMFEDKHEKINVYLLSFFLGILCDIFLS